MKTIITTLLLILSITTYSQIGMHKDEIIDVYDIDVYTLNDNYYQLVSKTDTLITLYIMDYETLLCVGIDYLHSDREGLNTSLSDALNGTYELGKDVYIRGDIIILITEYEIKLRDVRYITREASRGENNQSILRSGGTK